MAVLETFTKSSAESYPVAVDYSDQVPTGVTLASASAGAIDLLDNSTPSPAVATGATVAGNSSTCRIQNGTDGHSYLVTLTTTLSDGSVLADQFVVNISDRPLLSGE